MASSTIVLICSIILCYMVGNSLATPTNIEDTEPKGSQEGPDLIAIVSSIEPAQCYRRLVCDLDTGIDSSKENDDIETPTATTESQHRLSLTNNIDVLREKIAITQCKIIYHCPMENLKEGADQKRAADVQTEGSQEDSALNTAAAAAS
ncbi:uncharacterized protein [Dysidea avara]|uniref:uncharacterized protein isoform X2 n=1 Tax=Dysidea avara TaxID=196820 RepID=UPI00332B52E8